MSLTDLIIKLDPMKKYLASPKGLAAKKRAQAKYLASERGKLALLRVSTALNMPTTVTVDAVRKCMDSFCMNLVESTKYCMLENLELMDESKFPRYIYEPVNTLWGYVCKNAGEIKRKDFMMRIESLLPLLEIVPRWVKDGKTIYTPAVKINTAIAMRFMNDDGTPDLSGISELIDDYVRKQNPEHFVPADGGTSFEGFHKEYCCPQVTREYFESCMQLL